MEGGDREFSVAAQSAPQKAALPQKPPFSGDLVLESHYGRPPLRQKSLCRPIVALRVENAKEVTRVSSIVP